jgi:hypothetical protein
MKISAHFDKHSSTMVFYLTFVQSSKPIAVFYFLCASCLKRASSTCFPADGAPHRSTGKDLLEYDCLGKAGPYRKCPLFGVFELRAFGRGLPIGDSSKLIVDSGESRYLQNYQVNSRERLSDCSPCLLAIRVAPVISDSSSKP